MWHNRIGQLVPGKFLNHAIIIFSKWLSLRLKVWIVCNVAAKDHQSEYIISVGPLHIPDFDAKIFCPC